MKNILARGGVEFLAVFLGIALSLWVDDYREDKELNDRITDDYENIYEEVNANLAIIEHVIAENKEVISAEEEILKILNGELPYDHDAIANLVGKIYSPTFFGETSAHRTSVASGRFNSSKNDELNRQISSIYEHYYVRLKNNGDWLDSIYKQGFGYTYPFNKAIYKQKNVDKAVIKQHFFSDEFHNGLLNFRFARSIYLQRLEDTKDLLGQVKVNLEKYLVSPSFNLDGADRLASRLKIDENELLGYFAIGESYSFYDHPVDAIVDKESLRNISRLEKSFNSNIQFMRDLTSID